jgi:benzoyl-CoA reductase/2-hydroxyglutaryl-CoA dehydratase subunit BcrC/BadD/HgdB
MNRRIGITSTIPTEVVFAAGDVPVDLNNLFINDPDPSRFIRFAEEAGYPRNICCWVKGLYGVVMESRRVDVVIALTQGDCSNTLALVETLMVKGVPVITFEYPFGCDRDLLSLQIEKLAEGLGTTVAAAGLWVNKLRPVREKLAEIDRLTWTDDNDEDAGSGGTVSGAENHRFLVSASDFEGDPVRFEREVDAFLDDARIRTPHADRSGGIRLGYIGVPPIWGGLYEFFESQGAFVVFNETQRQFSMCRTAQVSSLEDSKGKNEADKTNVGTDAGLVDQYSSYTYPYGVFARLEDIEAEISRRNIEGIVHYTQSFCFRQIEDMIFREKLDVPILTIDGDQPAPLDGRTKLRMTAFMEMLRKKRRSMVPGSGTQADGFSACDGKDS